MSENISVFRQNVVEVRGIEPLSEDTMIGFSPSGVRNLHSRVRPPAGGLPELVASFYRCRLKALTNLFLTSMAPAIPSRERLGPTFSALRLRKRNSDCCQLIYVPVLTRSGAAARLPYLRPSPSKPVHPHNGALNTAGLWYRCAGRAPYRAVRLFWPGRLVCRAGVCRCKRPVPF